MARRHWLLLAALPLAALLLAAVYILSAKPLYMARAQVLLDTRKLQLFQNQALVSDQTFEIAAVESQMELIRSEAVASSVVDDLNLATDPEFTTEPTNPFLSALAPVIRLMGSRIANRVYGPPPDAQQQRSAAIDHFRSNLQIQRLRTTYVIEVSFTSMDAAKAARVANAVADAYILDQTQSKQYTTRRAMNWLQERMAELREQAITAERAVQEFRTKNNLIKLGGGVMTDQQMQEMNSQLARAREIRTEAKLRLDRLQDVMKSRVPDAAMAAWLQNDVINRLRQSYVEAQRREADYAVRLGPDHQAVVAARKDMAQIEQSAAKELKRILAAYTSELEAAEAREKALEKQFSVESVQNAASRGQQGTLQLLESTARNYSQLHDLFFQRFLEASQQQNFTTTEARTITPAGLGIKVSPNAKQVFVMAGAFGLIMACGAVYLRERPDGSLRTSTEFESSLGVDCLGILPASEAAQEHDVGTSLGDASAKLLSADRGVSRQVLSQPFSRFAETVRNLKVVVDRSPTELKVVGVVSALPREGKSTVAVNLAQLTASSGRRVLLIDADLRRRSLTATMAPRAKSGLIEVLNGTDSLSLTVWKDPSTGLHFLPSVMSGRNANTTEILASQAMTQLLSYARDIYDYVILDFPPLAPVVDAKAISHNVDGFILVVEWGRTSQAIVSETLGSADVIRSRLVGGVLNKADTAILSGLESHKGTSYHSYYSA